jgi:hypothetical protein
MIYKFNVKLYKAKSFFNIVLYNWCDKDGTDSSVVFILFSIALKFECLHSFSIKNFDYRLF